MATTTIYQHVRLEHFTCWVCGCNFAADQDVVAGKREYGRSLYCPNGCQLGFGETPEQKLRKEMESKLATAKREKEYLEARLCDTRGKLQSAENARRAEKAAKTRIKNRVSKGVCPCCNRFFANLHRHMASQHPDFNQEP